MHGKPNRHLMWIGPEDSVSAIRQGMNVIAWAQEPRLCFVFEKQSCGAAQEDHPLVPILALARDAIGDGAPSSVPSIRLACASTRLSVSPWIAARRLSAIAGSSTAAEVMTRSEVTVCEVMARTAQIASRHSHAAATSKREPLRSSSRRKNRGYGSPFSFS